MNPDQFTRNGLTLEVPQDVPGAARRALLRLCCRGVHHADGKDKARVVAAVAPQVASAATDYPLGLEG
ncbi:MAG TPA: hypothetical protein VM537_01050 [Anaerolineae bacterium]|nr:hypothetical protein [Anaerolineae bacterium]